MSRKVSQAMSRLVLRWRRSRRRRGGRQMARAIEQRQEAYRALARIQKEDA